MKRSTTRILTTNVGSLARPHDLLDVMREKEHGRPYDPAAFASLVKTAVGDAVPVGAFVNNQFAATTFGCVAPTDEEALSNAMVEWPNGGMAFPKQDIRNPEDIANMAKLIRPEHFTNRVLISPDLDEHAAHIQKFVDMGFDEVHLHNVGRNQAEFIKAFGEKVLPQLRLG